MEYCSKKSIIFHIVNMYRFQVISDGYIIFSTNEFNSFIDLVNNTKFEFDFIDRFGYQVVLFKDGKVLNILK